jgi:ATP-GRASP peptide maturase of grasp-with-spasm system
MILIITEKDDYTTFEVCDWLIKMKKKFIIINENTLFKVELIEINNKKTVLTLNIDGEKYKSNQIKSVWFRRAGIRIQYNSLNDLYLENEFVNQIEKYIIEESKGLVLFIEYFFSEIKSIGSPYKKLNKLSVLKKANSIGLNTPKTIITTSKKDLKKFIKSNCKVLSKAITENFHFSKKNENYYHPNVVFDEVNLKFIPDFFQITLFQEYIDKKFEIRVFYFNKKCYSMAIFSQNNEKTKMDFRNYDRENPNRCIPFKLPHEIETKIDLLMEMNELNCGSIDLIYTYGMEYYFLEINPMGQFGWVSHKCNYEIEKKIAEYL